MRRPSRGGAFTIGSRLIIDWLPIILHLLYPLQSYFLPWYWTAQYLFIGFISAHTPR